MNRKGYLHYIALILMILILTACSSGSVSNQAASRKAGFSDESIVYINSDEVALASKAATDATKKATKEAFDLVNKTRTDAGLKALTWTTDLEQASTVRVVEASESFSHTRPDGTDWWTVNSDIMYGENLAKGYSTAEDVVKAWIASPTHKENIMDKDFTSGAIAIYVCDGVWYWSQEFGY